MSSTRSPAVVLSQHEPIHDAVLAAGAAAGHEVVVLNEVSELLAMWASSSVVFIGEDAAAEVAALAPPHRDRVHLVGEDPAELGRWSMVIGATVAVVPYGAGLLTDAFAGSDQSDTAVVALVGGAGGVGTSTTAIGLAQAGRGASLVVDADSDGGGLDLLVGLEAEPGWRWGELGRARGHLGVLRGHLPGVDDLEVLAMGRGPDGPHPAPEAVPSVLDAARRGHDWVVVDTGRGRCPLGLAALRVADTVVMMTRADVRAVAATQTRLRALAAERISVAGLLVREVAGSGLTSDEIGEVLGVPVWERVPGDRRIAEAGARGAPPSRAAGRRWRAACDRPAQRVQR